MREAHERGEATDSSQLEIIGRKALASERREQLPDLRTWGPGESQPSPVPEHGVYDLDGDVWFHQGASGCWRMSAADRRRNSDSVVDVEGQRPWFYLVDSMGPLTERPDPRRGA